MPRIEGYIDYKAKAENLLKMRREAPKEEREEQEKPPSYKKILKELEEEQIL